MDPTVLAYTLSLKLILVTDSFCEDIVRGVEEGYEEYIIEGKPTIKVKMSEMLGDWEMAHIAVNIIPKVININQDYRR